MNLEIINKLFLELSQVATAQTKRELDLEKDLRSMKAAYYAAAERPEITDTDRLNLLLGFVALRSIYDWESAPPFGPSVDDYGLEKLLENPSLFDAVKDEIKDMDPKDGWEKRCIIAGIDYAIREKRKRNERV